MSALDLLASSRAEEAGYVALQDVAALADACGIDYRLVGGQMVSLHVAAAGVVEPTIRLTLDADLGVEPAVAADPAIVSKLIELGYDRPDVANRFERTDSHGRNLIIDLLTASYNGHLVTNVSHGDMTLDAIPGLSLALALPGEVLDLRAHLMDGSVINMTIVVPDALAALCLKVVGWADRRAAKDAFDVWRLLRVFVARTRHHEWRSNGVEGDAAKVLRADFAQVNGLGVKMATRVPAEQAEVRALALRALGAQG